MPEPQAGVLTTPDEQLIEQVKAGDLVAREELFRRHFGVSQRVAVRLLGHDQDALDAVQDGFLKAVLHLEDFDGRSGFRTWLLKIVTNAALDLGRKRRRRLTLRLDDVGTGDPGAAMNHDPALGLHRQDLRRALDAALDRLSPATRACFILFAEAELSYKEIAACQNIPLGTVMSRLHYARQKLQSSLEGVEGID
ncbi:MAG: RNA polymerase sigma factor [Isosphaeraceae bacterium]